MADRAPGPTPARQSGLLSLALLLAVPAAGTGAELALATAGRTDYVILTQPGLAPAEAHAGRELAHFLERVTGARFPLQSATAALPERAILVGPGPATRAAFPDVDLARLGPEEVVICVRGQRLLLAGGRPRGTLYAVYRFLHEIGCRWWAPWAETMPRHSTLSVPMRDQRHRPAFTWREPYWFPALEPTWAARNHVNGAHVRATAATGGHLHYGGFVHTFDTLVPPAAVFPKHPEWFSLVQGRRRPDAQLCLTNPQLGRFVAGRVKEVLRANPEANIVSVSQNDRAGPCACPACRRLDEDQESPAGALLAFVNAVAAEVHQDYPQVLIDTLAYRYTRKPPRDLRPGPGVVVRVCAIEGDFGVPLDHPRNAAYAADLRTWARRCPGLFVWDYTTNFSHYLLPHPNWFVLGPNLRFFRQQGVASVFAQGIDRPGGGDLPELRAWVLARLLWDPQQDDGALIDEFLAGYYGAAAAPLLRRYLALMHRALGDYPLSCFNAPERSPFLRFAVLSEAEQLWAQAYEACRHEPDRAWRVQQGWLSVRYAWLVRWVALRRECQDAGAAWPLPPSRPAVAQEWLAVATGPGPAGWSPLEALEEFPGRIKPAAFAARLAVEPGQGNQAEAPPVPGFWTLLGADLLGPPRGLIALGAAPLVVTLLLARWRAPGGWKRTRRSLACGALALLVAATGCYSGMREALPARSVGYVALGVLGALALAAPLLCLQLLPLGRRRAVALSAAVLGLLGLGLWTSRPYLQLRLTPQAYRDYHGAGFRGAALRQANLDGLHLAEADFTRADLGEANLNFADLRGARLCGADLRGARLQYTDLQGADLRGADLRGAQLRDITFTALMGAFYDGHTLWPDGLDPRDWDTVGVP